MHIAIAPTLGGEDHIDIGIRRHTLFKCQFQLTIKATTVIRTNIFLNLLVSVAIFAFACDSVSAATDSRVGVDATTVVSMPLTFRIAMFADISEPSDISMNSSVVLTKKTMLKLVLALLASVGASIGFYFQRIADRNNIRQMLNGSSEWHSEPSETIGRNR